MRWISLPLFSIIAAGAVLLTLPWHWRARNVPTLSLIFWLLLADLTTFVNAVIWSGNYADHSPGLCDISIRIYIAASMAVPACSLAQMRRLESIASNRRVNISAKEKARRTGVELALCMGSPLVMLLFYLSAQGHRYDIWENIGCQQPIYYSWLSFTLMQVVPLAVSLLAMAYAALALRCFVRKRLQFQAVLTSAQSGLTNSRFLRLICLAVLEGSLASAGNIFTAVKGLEGLGLRPLTGWTSLHQDYSLIVQYPQDLTPDFSVRILLLFLFPVYSLIFFALFGFGDEAVKEYLAVGIRIRGLFQQDKSRRPRDSYKLSASNLGTTVTTFSKRETDFDLVREEAFIDLGTLGTSPSSTQLSFAQAGGGKGVAVKVETSVV